jgi:hypothetical protein
MGSPSSHDSLTAASPEVSPASMPPFGTANQPQADWLFMALIAQDQASDAVVTSALPSGPT